MAHRSAEEGVFCGDWLQSHTATYRPGMHTTAPVIFAGDLWVWGLFSYHLWYERGILKKKKKKAKEKQN